MERRTPFNPSLRIPIILMLVCLVIGGIFYGGFSMGAGSRTQGTKSASLQSMSEEETTRKGVAKCESDTAEMYQSLTDKKTAIGVKLAALQADISNLRKRTDLSTKHLKEAQERTADCERDLAVQRAAWVEEDEQLMKRIHKEHAELAALKSAFFQLTDGRGARALTTVAALSSVRQTYRRLRRSVGKPMPDAPAFQAEVEAELLTNWGPHLTNLTELDEQLPLPSIDTALSTIVEEWQDFNFSGMQAVAKANDVVVLGSGGHSSNVTTSNVTGADSVPTSSFVVIDQFPIFFEHHLPDGANARPTFRHQVMAPPMTITKSVLRQNVSSATVPPVAAIKVVSLVSSMLGVYDSLVCGYHRAVEGATPNEVAVKLVNMENAASHPNATTQQITSPFVLPDDYQWGQEDVIVPANPEPHHCPTNTTCTAPPVEGGTPSKLSDVLDTPLLTFCSGCTDMTRTRMFTLACGVQPSLLDYGSFEFWAARSRLRFHHDVYDAADKFLEEQDLLDKPYVAVVYHISADVDTMCSRGASNSSSMPSYLRHRLWYERSFGINNTHHMGASIGARCNPSEQQLQASLSTMLERSGAPATAAAGTVPVYVSLNSGSSITLDDLSGARVKSDPKEAVPGDVTTQAVGAIANAKVSVMSRKVHNQFDEAVDVVLASRATHLLVSAYLPHSQVITEEHLLKRKFNPKGVYFM